jgi:hypothetical protein
MDQPITVSNHEKPAMSPSVFVVKRMSCAVWQLSVIRACDDQRSRFPF